MAEKYLHVIRHPDGGWVVKKDGARRASRHFDSKQAAISWGRERSKIQKAEFVIHKRDGTVQEIYTHGDPPPSLSRVRR